MATFDQAWRLAVRRAIAEEVDYVVLFTCDPEQPYIAEPDTGQPNAIALIGATKPSHGDCHRGTVADGS